MSPTAAKPWLRVFKNRRMLVLLVSLLLLMLVSPFVNGSLVVAILFTVTLFSAVSAVRGSRRATLGALVLGLPFFAGIWISQSTAHPIAGWATLICGTLFLAYTTGIVLRHVLWASDVNAEVLFGAAAVYLLIGHTFAMLCILVETAVPGSFTNLTYSPNSTLDIDALFYYSFVTLASLGYGDITPTWDVPRTIAIFESVLGIFYTTILVARLVSVYTAQAMIGGSDEADKRLDQSDTAHGNVREREHS